MVTNVTTRETGKFKLNGKAVISDPCYSLDSGNVIKNVWPGIYHAFQRECTAGVWGRRVSRLIAVHENFLGAVRYDASDKDDLETFFSGVTCEEGEDAGVDSGQMGIYDYDYFRQNESQRDYHNPSDWYRRVCDTTTGATGGVIDSRCAVSSSGCGDGCYRTLIFRDKKTRKAVAFAIDFGLEYDDEDEEDIYITCGECAYCVTDPGTGECRCNCTNGSLYYGETVNSWDGCEHGEL